MIEMYSCDKSYKIVFERIKSIFNQNGYNCSLSFYNFLNQFQFNITMTKNDVLRLMVFIYDYFTRSILSGDIIINSISQNMEAYKIYISQSDTGGDYLIISKINLITNYQVDMIRLVLDDCQGSEFGILEFFDNLYLLFIKEDSSNSIFEYYFPEFYLEEEDGGYY